MSLSTLLGKISGVQGAVLVASTGELLDSFGEDDETFAAIIHFVVNELDRAGEGLGFGELRSLSVTPGIQVLRTDEVIAAVLHQRAKIPEIVAAVESLHIAEVDGAPVLVGYSEGGDDSDVTVEVRAAVEPAEQVGQPTPSLQEAAQQLRRALAEGHLGEAEAAATRLQQILGVESESEEALRDRANLATVIEGIGASLTGDPRRALECVETIRNGAESVRWAAQLWTAQSALECGEVTFARHAAANASKLADSFEDPWSQAFSRRVEGWVALRLGEIDDGISHLNGARLLFAQLADNEGLGACWLAQASALSALSREMPQHLDEALVAADKAIELMPTSVNAMVLRAKLALRLGQYDRAEQLLNSIERPQGSANAAREVALVEAVKQERISSEIAMELSWLQDALPNDDNVAGLKKLLLQAPGFALIREALALKLLGLGNYSAAAEHLEQLAQRSDLPDALRVGVRLGLGCIANARARRNPSGMHRRTTALSVSSDSNLDRVSRSSGETAPLDDAKPVFVGELRLFAIPDLLEFLRNGRRTGTLLISGPEGLGAVHLQDGWITGAHSTGSKSLGELLVEQGAIAEEALQPFIDGQAEDSETLLGSMLVEEGLVEPNTVQAALRRQVHLALRQLVTWPSDGQFAFDPDAIAEGSDDDDAVSIALDVQHTLLDVFKELDEEQR